VIESRTKMHVAVVMLHTVVRSLLPTCIATGDTLAEKFLLDRLWQFYSKCLKCLANCSQGVPVSGSQQAVHSSERSSWGLRQSLPNRYGMF
jgi:hypothetical protein